MSAIPPIAPLGSSATEIDAFRSAMSSAGTAIGVDPSAMGHMLADGIAKFQAQEIDFRHAAASAIDGSTTTVEPTSDAAVTVATSTGDTPAVTGSSNSIAGSHQKTMGLMMQTFSFALEATLVSTAATTFTNSVNTLIKTQ